MTNTALHSHAIRTEDRLAAAAWLTAHRSELGAAEMPGLKVVGKERFATLGQGTYDPHFHTARTETAGQTQSDALPLTAKQLAHRAAVADAQPVDTMPRLDRRHMTAAFDYGFRPEFHVYTGPTRKLTKSTAVLGENVRSLFRIKNAQNHRRNDGLRVDVTAQFDEAYVAPVEDHMARLCRVAETTDLVTRTRKAIATLTPAMQQVMGDIEMGMSKEQAASLNGLTLRAVNYAAQEVRRLAATL